MDWQSVSVEQLVENDLIQHFYLNELTDYLHMPNMLKWMWNIVAILSVKQPGAVGFSRGSKPVDGVCTREGVTIFKHLLIFHKQPGIITFNWNRCTETITFTKNVM